MQRCSLSWRTLDRECSSERLDPVFEADQAGATGEVGAAAAVVADADPQDAVAGASTCDLDVTARRARAWPRWSAPRRPRSRRRSRSARAAARRPVRPARPGRRSGGPAPCSAGPQAALGEDRPGGCRGRARAVRPGRRSTSAASPSSCAASSTASGGTAACARCAAAAPARPAAAGRRRAGRARCGGGRWSAAATIRAREAVSCGLALRVGDGGGDQLGEVGQPRLGVRRQRLLARGMTPS